MELINSILGFIIAIGILVTFHEYGHFIVARLCNVKVLKFSVGFGKAMFKYQSDKNFKKQVKSTLLKKGSKPTDISNTLNYILATESLTGQLIVVDGGEHLSWTEIK